jgi:hypothetical protein
MKFQTRQLFRKIFDSFIAERLERGAWPLLTVETEVQEMGTQRVQMKGIYLGWFVGLVVQVKGLFVLP